MTRKWRPFFICLVTEITRSSWSKNTGVRIWRDKQRFCDLEQARSILLRSRLLVYVMWQVKHDISGPGCSSCLCGSADHGPIIMNDSDLVEKIIEVYSCSLILGNFEENLGRSSFYGRIYVLSTAFGGRLEEVPFGKSAMFRIVVIYLGLHFCTHYMHCFVVLVFPYCGCVKNNNTSFLETPSTIAT